MHAYFIRCTVCLRKIRGFSLLELLVTTSIIAILAMLALTAASSAQRRFAEGACSSNFRSLNIAWRLYSTDNNESFVINVDGFLGGFTNWVAGNMGNVSDVHDSALLAHDSRSLLARYITNPKIYKCPADKTENVRSVSMNCRFNPVRNNAEPRWVGGLGNAFRTFRRSADLVAPAIIFVFADENETTINDGYFAVDMSNTGTENGLGNVNPFFVIDSPAFRHRKGAMFAFSDGHVAPKRWSAELAGIARQPRTHIPPPGRDILWLQGHCTQK